MKKGMEDGTTEAKLMVECSKDRMLKAEVEFSLEVHTECKNDTACTLTITLCLTIAFRNPSGSNPGVVTSVPPSCRVPSSMGAIP